MFVLSLGRWAFILCFLACSNHAYCGDDVLQDLFDAKEFEELVSVSEKVELCTHDASCDSLDVIKSYSYIVASQISTEPKSGMVLLDAFIKTVNDGSSQKRNSIYALLEVALAFSYFGRCDIQTLLVARARYALEKYKRKDSILSERLEVLEFLNAEICHTEARREQKYSSEKVALYRRLHPEYAMLLICLGGRSRFDFDIENENISCEDELKRVGIPKGGFRWNSVHQQRLSGGHPTRD